MLSEERISRVVQHYQHDPAQACDFLLQLPRGKCAPPASPFWSAYTILPRAFLFLSLVALVMLASVVYSTEILLNSALLYVAVVTLTVVIFEMVDWYNAEKRYRKQMNQPAHFYHKDELESLSQSPCSAGSPMDPEAIGAEMASYLQKWVNADPINHNRLTLFRAIRQHQYGTPGLARVVLEGTGKCLSKRMAQTTQWSPAILGYDGECVVGHINVFGLVFYTRQLEVCRSSELREMRTIMHSLRAVSHVETTKPCTCSGIIGFFTIES